MRGRWKGGRSKLVDVTEGCCASARELQQVLKQRNYIPGFPLCCAQNSLSSSCRERIIRRSPTRRSDIFAFSEDVRIVRPNKRWVVLLIRAQNGRKDYFRDEKIKNCDLTCDWSRQVAFIVKKHSSSKPRLTFSSITITIRQDPKRRRKKERGNCSINSAIPNSDFSQTSEDKEQILITKM